VSCGLLSLAYLRLFNILEKKWKEKRKRKSRMNNQWIYSSFYALICQSGGFNASVPALVHAPALFSLTSKCRGKGKEMETLHFTKAH
jgi:hypothetical protein